MLTHTLRTQNQHHGHTAHALTVENVPTTRTCPSDRAVIVALVCDHPTAIREVVTAQVTHCFGVRCWQSHQVPPLHVVCGFSLFLHFSHTNPTMEHFISERLSVVIT